jgi:hypothetical protein
METKSETVDTIRRPIRGPQAPPMKQIKPAGITSGSQITSSPTAVVYCEGNFAQIDGKTANGLVRHSQAYRILSVIDTTYSGQDSGSVLDDAINHISFVAQIAICKDSLFESSMIANCHEQLDPDDVQDPKLGGV